MIHEVVIIGGGFGGIRVAKMLSRMSLDAHITLIDKNRFHTFYPDLYEVATVHISETVRPKLNFHNILSTASYALEDVFLHELNVTILHDEVTAIAPDKHTISLKSGATHEYDVLVVGAGSETNYFNIPGLSEHALPLRSFYDALNVRNAVDEAFARLPKNHLIKIVIGGGGFTGCEFTGELTGYLKKLSKVHGRPEYYAECTVIEASDSLLGGASAWLKQKALERLSSLGVHCMLKSPIKEVGSREVILSNGIAVPYDVLVWSGGVKANELVRSIAGVKLEKNVCVLVDRYLRLAPYQDVFGVGDITYCVDEKTGKAMPMTASVALREAKWVARNIARALEKKKLKEYIPHTAGFIIPLGGQYALLESHGIHLSGKIPWYIKQVVAVHYWSTILGWRRAIKLVRRGLKIFRENDI